MEAGRGRNSARSLGNVNLKKHSKRIGIIEGKGGHRMKKPIATDRYSFSSPLELFCSKSLTCFRVFSHLPEHSKKIQRRHAVPFLILSLCLYSLSPILPQLPFHPMILCGFFPHPRFSQAAEDSTSALSWSLCVVAWPL